MNSVKRAAFATVLTGMTCLPGKTALAACNATVNGRPMSPQLCATVVQVYGQVIPGDYLLDGNGNWVNANNPIHRGNIYRDARSSTGSPSSGSWGGSSYVSPGVVYDSTYGCEGGSCVNIID